VKRTIGYCILGILTILLAHTAYAQVNDYAVSWWSVDGGGGVSSGGQFALQATAGQADAAIMDGGTYTLTSGFWARANHAPTCSQQDLSFSHIGTHFPHRNISFSASCGNAQDITYDWDFGNGETASGADVTYSYARSGYYDVTVKATQNSVSIEKSKTVLIFWVIYLGEILAFSP
jgi:hypothetical protein